jgi:predicted dithiol-disulfide oxidoreductase (DUF899 family)
MLLIFGDEDELRKVGGVQNKDHALAAKSARYVFDTPKGKKNLSELFDGRSQLIITSCLAQAGAQAAPAVLFSPITSMVPCPISNITT